MSSGDNFGEMNQRSICRFLGSKRESLTDREADSVGMRIGEMSLEDALTIFKDRRVSPFLEMPGASIALASHLSGGAIELWDALASVELHTKVGLWLGALSHAKAELSEIEEKLVKEVLGKAGISEDGSEDILEAVVTFEAISSSLPGINKPLRVRIGNAIVPPALDAAVSGTLDDFVQPYVISAAAELGRGGAEVLQVDAVLKLSEDIEKSEVDVVLRQSLIYLLAVTGASFLVRESGRMPRKLEKAIRHLVELTHSGRERDLRIMALHGVGGLAVASGGASLGFFNYRSMEAIKDALLSPYEEYRTAGLSCVEGFIAAGEEGGEFLARNKTVFEAFLTKKVETETEGRMRRYELITRLRDELGEWFDKAFPEMGDSLLGEVKSGPYLQFNRDVEVMAEGMM